MNNASDEQIAKLCRTLQPANPLRRQAEMLLANRLAPIEDIKPVLHAIKFRTGSHKTKGDVAAWLVENAAWTEDQRVTITNTLSAFVGTAIRSRKPASYMFLRGLIFSLIYLSVNFVGFWGRYSLPELLELLFAPAVIMLVGSIVTVALLVLLVKLLLNPIMRNVELLGKIGGPSCIGTLAVAYMDEPMRVAAGAALKRVAVRVRPEDYGTLPSQTVQSLCRALTKTDQETAIIILNVLETIGDERAIDAVARKITKTGSPEVREAAFRVLATLRQRADRGQTSAMLLRPSSAEPDAEKILLRAAREPGDMHEEQLLRVSED